MKRLAVIGIVAFALLTLGAMGFIGWNLYTLTQTNGAYGRGMMQTMMREHMHESANPNTSTTATNGRGMGMMSMMGGRGMDMMQGGMMGMMNGRGNAVDDIANCPCNNNGAISPQTAPANNPTPAPTIAPTVAPKSQTSASSSSSTASSSASTTSSSASSSATSAKPGFAGKAGNLNVTLSMNPQPAAFSSTTFDITITDEKGAAVSDATVSLDLTMPSMYMPSNKPQAQSLGDGKYQAAGRFTMRGGWRININIVRGGQTQTVYFDINL